MSSADLPGRHLDATDGHEVLFCHVCNYEWYRDDRGLVCPNCESEAVEIVEPDHDPRQEDVPATSRFNQPSPTIFNRGPDSDSDPDEPDIEQIVREDPNGFVMRQTIYRSSPRPRDATPRPGANAPLDPNDSEAILRRFTDMLMTDFRVGQPGRSGQQTLFPPTGTNDFYSGPAVQSTTWSTGPRFSGGTATFTIATGPPLRRAGPGGPPDFESVFGGLMHNTAGPPNIGGPAGQNGPGAGFAQGLNQLLASLLNPAAAVHGDAVYTQEALDRIITSLMEANPQSNAAPPATESAIEKLERKKLDDKMIGPEGKAECTICIDDMHKGDEVLILPCKHWFHEECVVLWLKEHNTCPICRTPIEGAANSGNNSQGTGASGGSSSNNAASSSNSNNTSNRPGGQRPQQQPPTPPFSSFPPLHSVHQQARDHHARQAAANAARIERIRHEQSYRQGSQSPRSLQSPRPHGSSESTTRSRARSPSQRDQYRGQSGTGGSSDAADTASQDNQGGGVSTWFRDHFGGGSGGTTGSQRRS